MKNLNQDTKKSYDFKDIAAAMEALSTCAHILKIPEEGINEENKTALANIWKTASTVSSMVNTMITSSPISTSEVPVIKLQTPVVEPAKEPEKVTTPEEKPVVVKPKKESTPPPMPAPEAAPEETSEESVQTIPVEAPKETPAVNPKETPEVETEENTPEEGPVRQTTLELARTVCFNKVAQVAAEKHVIQVDDLSTVDRNALKAFIAASYPEQDLKSNMKNKKILTKFVTELLREYLASQKQEVVKVTESTQTKSADIIKDQTAGNALLEKIEEKKKQEETAPVQQSNNAPTTPVTPVVTKPTVTPKTETTVATAPKKEKVDSWKLLHEAKEAALIQDAVINLRKKLGTGEGVKSETFQTKKNTLGASIQNILVQRSQKEPTLVKVLETFKKDRDNAITGLLIDSFKQASVELAKAQ